jgi:hypothetical protein
MLILNIMLILHLQIKNLSFCSRTRKILVKIRNFAGISRFSTRCRCLFINPITYFNRAWKTAPIQQSHLSSKVFCTLGLMQRVTQMVFIPPFWSYFAFRSYWVFPVIFIHPNSDRPWNSTPKNAFPGFLETSTCEMGVKNLVWT